MYQRYLWKNFWKQKEIFGLVSDKSFQETFFAFLDMKGRGKDVKGRGELDWHYWYFFWRGVGGGGQGGRSEQNFSCQGALSLLDLYRKRKLKPIRNTMCSMSWKCRIIILYNFKKKISSTIRDTLCCKCLRSLACL